MAGRTTGEGFAVIDFETTGLHPEGTDRAIEVGVVLTDPDGVIQVERETLVRVDRDLGLQARHGIHAADLLEAPAFAQIAGDLVELLRGRVPVAHNASFDARFLDAEMRRLGTPTDRHDIPWTCTMQLAARFGLGSRSLEECCDEVGIPLSQAHRAVADAHATAELLANYLAETPPAGWRFWLERLNAAATLPWPELPSLHAEWVPRPDSTASETVPSFLSRLVAHVPDFSTDESQREYLALLDRCLLDRRLSTTEQHQLIELADASGIGHDTARRLHQRYLDALVAAAWADGVVTGTERQDIIAVCTLLDLPTPDLERPRPVTVGGTGTGVDGVDADEVRPTHRGIGHTDADGAGGRQPVLATPGGFTLNPGDRVCLTGEMRRSREEWEAELTARGLTVWPSVTKKVRLLIAADPDSQSGKARKARQYGIPIVDEAWLDELCGALPPLTAPPAATPPRR